MATPTVIGPYTAGEIDSHEVAWAAGFFDGEGSVGVERNHREAGARLERLILTVSASQKDRQVLDRLCRAVLGIGEVKGPRTVRTRFQIWEWRVRNFEGAQAVMAMLWNWLSPIKREQFKLAHAAVVGQRAHLKKRSSHGGHLPRDGHGRWRKS